MMVCMRPPPKWGTRKFAARRDCSLFEVPTLERPSHLKLCEKVEASNLEARFKVVHTQMLCYRLFHMSRARHSFALLDRGSESLARADDLEETVDVSVGTRPSLNHKTWSENKVSPAWMQKTLVPQ